MIILYHYEASSSGFRCFLFGRPDKDSYMISRDSVLLAIHQNMCDCDPRCFCNLRKRNFILTGVYIGLLPIGNPDCTLK